jgi:hypothetical protein
LIVAAVEVHIEQAGHIQVLTIVNLVVVGRGVDSILLEEIERPLREEERSFLLGKLISEVVVEKVVLPRGDVSQIEMVGRMPYQSLVCQ